MENKEARLVYNGIAMDMDKTVEAICLEYPEIKKELGFFMYNVAKRMTLKQVCDRFGFDTVQKEIDKRSAK